MLQEVSQTILVGSFQYCTCIRGKIQLYALCGEFIVTDVVSETVIQFAHLDGRVPGKRTKHRVVLSGHRDCRERGKNNNK